MTEMTNGEIGRRLAELSLQMSQGFGGVHGRIDGLTGEVRIQNGRVTALERATDVAAHKVLNLEREVFSPLKRPVTRGDVYLVVAAIGAVAAIVKWLPALQRIGQGAP